MWYSCALLTTTARILNLSICSRAIHNFTPLGKLTLHWQVLRGGVEHNNTVHLCKHLWMTTISPFFRGLVVEATKTFSVSYNCE